MESCPHLSFTQIDQYLRCPLKHRLSDMVRDKQIEDGKDEWWMSEF